MSSMIMMQFYLDLGHSELERSKHTRGNFFWQSLRTNYQPLPQNGLPIEVAAHVQATRLSVSAG
jgi:hypothetical protein